MRAVETETAAALGSDVHVRPVWLQASGAVLPRLRALLSADEQARADRFKFAHLTESFICGRAALRLLLSGYTGERPERIAFSYAKHGKPSLAQERGLRFNMSHSGKLALLAFARGCELGVDVELLRPMPDALPIAERFFSAVEAADLASLPEADRDLGFFYGWTRKEAYIKGIGEGLSHPLHTFRVPIRAEEQPAIRDLVPGGRCSTWSLHHLQPAPGYVGALAVSEYGRAVCVHEPTDPEQLLARTSLRVAQ